MNIVDKNIKFTYIRDQEASERVLTLARKWGKNGNKVHYSYALCRPDHDRFQKMLGREIACGRLAKEPRKVRPNSGSKFILRAIMQDIVSDETCPAIVRKIAKQWLYTETNTDTENTVYPFDKSHYITWI